jgi:TolB-like protein/class 3 adenylate cyclase
VTEAADRSRILTMVFTDLADSTALKTERGDAAVGPLIARHREHVRRLAAEAGGRIIDWAGDGCFLTFETPSAAVGFALRLQRAHAAERDLPRVRAGIHMGEVSERPDPDGDPAHLRVEGLAVDLAARICSLARPAQVLMSSGVADSARQRLGGDLLGQPILWRTHGSPTLRGFDRPLEIREALLEGVAPFAPAAARDHATPARVRGPARTRRSTLQIAILVVAALGAVVAYLGRVGLPDRAPAHERAGGELDGGDALTVPGFGGRPAIAVLPFDNLSADPEQAYFADGLAEDLITRLSTWRSFPVIARNSSFQYRGGSVDLRRVSAQLIDAASGEHVWAESYDRGVADVFALQDEISSIIAASLVGDLARAEAERARQRGTESLEAWSLYQLGLQHYDRLTPDDFAEAALLFERAVALDPRFATALGHLAFTRLWGTVLGSTNAAGQPPSAALGTARRAVDADPRDPVAHAALGWAHLMAGDVQGGLDSTRRAVELNPSLPDAWIWLGWAQLLAGDREACIAASERAQRLSPQGPWAYAAYDNLAWAYWEMGRYEAGLDAARRLVAARPGYLFGHVLVAINAVAVGRTGEASLALGEARRIRPELSLEVLQHTFGVPRPEIDARRDAALRQVGLE